MKTTNYSGWEYIKKSIKAKIRAKYEEKMWEWFKASKYEPL